MVGLAELEPRRPLAVRHRAVRGLNEAPPREGVRRALDVLLGVVADAHREQFEQLTPIVLVRLVLVVLVVVEPEQHRRVHRQFQQDRAEVGHANTPEHLKLAAVRPRMRRLGRRAGEDLVPEEAHLLLQRPLGIDHVEDPLPRRRCPRRPNAAIVPQQNVLVVVGERLLRQRPVKVRVDDVRIPPRKPLRVDEIVHDGLVALGHQRFQLVPRRAHPGPPHQMCHQGDLGGRHTLLLQSHRNS